MFLQGARRRGWRFGRVEGEPGCGARGKSWDGRALVWRGRALVEHRGTRPFDGIGRHWPLGGWVGGGLRVVGARGATSGEDFADDLAVNVGESAVGAVVAEGELGVVD